MQDPWNVAQRRHRQRCVEMHHTCINLRYPEIFLQTMVYVGFRDAQRHVPDPPPAQSASNLSDEENMDARPEQEEMEQAQNPF